MRHQQILDKESYTKVDVAAVWPVGLQVAPLPLLDFEDSATDIERPRSAVPDVPASVGKLIIAAYAGLLGSLSLATVGSGNSIFMIVIAAVFMVAFFSVPWVFLSQEPQDARRPALDQFMREGMGTLTGHSTGGAALIQMLVVPVCLTIGVLGIALAT